MNAAPRFPLRLRVVLTVARFEAGELARDPQVGYALAGAGALLYVLLVTRGALDPTGGLWVVVGIAPLVLLFLAGPRRGAAHETAFRRLVLTCPVRASEWFWGRALGLQSVTLAYAAIAAPGLAIELSVARAPGWAALNAFVALAAFALVLTFLGLGMSTLSTTRGAGLLALAAFAILASYRALGAMRVFPEGALRRACAFALTLAPSIPVAMAGGFAAPGDVPPWAIAVALLGTLVAVAGWSARRHGMRAPHPAILLGVWLVGALAVALTVSFAGGSGAGAAERARGADDARFDLLVPASLVVALPWLVAFTRKRMTRS